MVNHFDLIKARIAQSLLPNGYNIVKGEDNPISHNGDYVKDESGVWVKVNTDTDTFTKADVMKQMDIVEEQMGELETLHKSGEATIRHEKEYVALDRIYNTLHSQYKSM